MLSHFFCLSRARWQPERLFLLTLNWTFLCYYSYLYHTTLRIFVQLVQQKVFGRLFMVTDFSPLHATTHEVFTEKDVQRITGVV